MFSRTFRSRYRAFVLRVRRKQPYHKEKYLPCREGRSAREGRPCHLLEGLRAQREEWAGARRGRVRQSDNAGGMGTFSLTPERGGGRRLSQRPGRRKELAKQARKDRKKESKAICCQSIVKKVFQEAPTLEDKQKPAPWREEKRKTKRKKKKTKRTGSPQPRGQRAWSSGSWSQGGSLEAGGSRGASVRSLDTILRASGGLLEVSF